ncbi:MAG: hypothetical protein IPJ40_12090 [Saprospirales bacterium]|nr:hypothetical protein [Saprospirales bacterium]
MDNIVFGPAKTVAAETERALKRSGADMLVADCLLPTALIPAEAMGISRVIAFHFPEYMPGPNRPPGILGLQPAKGPLGGSATACWEGCFTWPSANTCPGQRGPGILLPASWTGRPTCSTGPTCG